MTPVEMLELPSMIHPIKKNDENGLEFTFPRSILQNLIIASRKSSLRQCSHIYVADFGCSDVQMVIEEEIEVLPFFVHLTNQLFCF